MMDNDAAALAGWAQNPNAPVNQRLAAAKQALDFYVGQQDQLQALLEDLRTNGEDCQGNPGWSGYADAAVKLAAILDGE